MSYDNIQPTQNTIPRSLTGTDADYRIQSAATAVAATSSDIWAGYAADVGGFKFPPGKCWIELEATGFPVYIRASLTATTATTLSNGTVLAVGVPRQFYVDPSKDLFWDHISPGGVGVLKWRRMGPVCDRSRI